MTDLTELQTKLDTGFYSLNTLEAEERDLLSQSLRSSGPFTAEQRGLLSRYWLLVPGDFDLSLGGRNQIPVRVTTAGHMVTPSKLLTNIRLTEAYYWAADYLSSWLIVPLTTDDFDIEVPDEES